MYLDKVRVRLNQWLFIKIASHLVSLHVCNGKGWHTLHPSSGWRHTRSSRWHAAHGGFVGLAIATVDNKSHVEGPFYVILEGDHPMTYKNSTHICSSPYYHPKRAKYHIKRFTNTKQQPPKQCLGVYMIPINLCLACSITLDSHTPNPDSQSNQCPLKPDCLDSFINLDESNQFRIIQSITPKPNPDWGCSFIYI